MSDALITNPVAVALAVAVEAAGRRGLSLAEVWEVAQSADPELAWTPGRRQQLSTTLNGLADQAIITWAAGRSAMDTTGSPPLPKRVRTTAINTPTKTTRPTVPTVWRPELERVHHLERPRPDELGALHAINTWLRDRPASTTPIPLRERSWEIFGDEKRLDRLITSRLFRDRVVTLELLDAFVVHPPFVHQRLAASGDILICENHQTYHSALTVLTSGDRNGFAIVGYGAGNQFPAAVSYVEDLNVGGDVIYFGDLDADGLRIAGAAAVEAERLGICRVRPATGLYQVMLSSPVTARSPAIRPEQASELVVWLDASTRDTAAALLTSGHRIPQEAVTARMMRELAEWR